MSQKPLLIPQSVLQAQGRASDPERNVWLSANAGSGKTHVLTERVIRLLLAGAAPASIVCLTYTKAAAAVMKTRIFDRLSHWTRLSDAALEEELSKLEHASVPASNHERAIKLATARRLFARALETPGGLKIQTIHAFCEAILHQFPVEANIAGHFELLDDLTARELIEEARRLCFDDIGRGLDANLTKSFHLLLERVGEFGLNALFAEAIVQRETLKPALKKFKRLADKLFYTAFGLDPEDDLQKLSHKLKQAALFDEQELIGLARYGGQRSNDFVEKLRRLQSQTDWCQFAPLVFAAYYDSKGEKPIADSQILVKAVRENMPEIEACFSAKKERLAALVDQYRALELAHLNAAAYRLIQSLIAHFEALKHARGLLDFDDLIHRTLGLLRRKGASQWVHYKLDRGIEHILVDEAQDTSRPQWQIIRLLSEEFFSGEGAQAATRTLFAVGDEKQSIYSFQGASPEDFAENAVRFKQKSRAALKLFDILRLDFSFRSTPDVLGAVDEVFSRQDNYQGLSAENIKTVHQAIRKGAPGEVLIWQALEAQKEEEPEDWGETIGHLDAPPLVLARQIAETIENWLKRGEVLVGQARLLRPGDIMVLVRTRDSFVHALGRELKNRAIAVAGSDRLRLNDHIAIRDLMALAHFVLQPADDLSLAALLKSPLFGLDELELYQLATQRGEGETLYQALHRWGKTDLKYASSYECLQHYRALADNVPVYEFYSHILSEDGGRGKILARLGTEASDVLDAFMDYSLAIQKHGLPGLQAFLETLSRAAPEIKREMDQSRDEVRIMTVHAAKGLEAAVVFLIDGGTQIWNARRAPKLLRLKQHENRSDKWPLMVWNPGKSHHIRILCEALDEVKQREEEEYRRLLYVGMTRAEDRLIVCGYKSKKTPAGSWLALLHQALIDKAVAVCPPPARGVVAWRYQQTSAQLALHEMALTAPPVAELPEFPDFLRKKMMAVPLLPRPLVPSKAAQLVDDDSGILPKNLLSSPILGDEGRGQPATLSDQAANAAIARGNLVHQLLQYLPDLPPPRRLEAARAFIARQGRNWQEEEQQRILNQIDGLLHDARLRRLFAPQSRAEVSVMGMLTLKSGARLVSGQIDRLAVFDDEILIADFKTGRVPQHAQDIPESYLIQMALYRQLLKKLYPGRLMTSLLIYSQGAPDIFPLEDEKLDWLYEKL